MSDQRTPEIVDGTDARDDGWVYVWCMNPTCRGKQRGGKGFTQLVRKERVTPGAHIECPECFAR